MKVEYTQNIYKTEVLFKGWQVSGNDLKYKYKCLKIC